MGDSHQMWPPRRLALCMPTLRTHAFSMRFRRENAAKLHTKTHTKTHRNAWGRGVRLQNACVRGVYIRCKVTLRSTLHECAVQTLHRDALRPVASQYVSMRLIASQCVSMRHNRPRCINPYYRMQTHIHARTPCG